MSNSKRDLYNSVKSQNAQIEVELAKMRDEYSTDAQRVKYIESEITGWVSINYMLWFVYYIAFIFVSYYLYENQDYPNNSKWLYWSMFLLYPFLITTIEIFIYNLFTFLRDFILANPYPKGRNNTPTISLMNALPAVYY